MTGLLRPTWTGITLLRHKDGAYGAARLARLAVTGEAVESVCLRPPVAEEIRPQPALCAILPQRLARYRRLYATLKTEFSLS